MAAFSGTHPRSTPPALDRSIGREALIWLAVAVACSRVLADLAAHWIAQPWSLYSAIFLPLLMVASWRDGSQARPSPAPLPGYLCLLGGLLIVATTIGGDMPRLARAALPLVFFGAARVIGRPRPAIALLALWIVPVPSVLVDSMAGWLAPLWSQLAASGGTIPRAGALLPLMALMAGLGHYVALRRDQRGMRLACSVLSSALIAIPLQALTWWSVRTGLEQNGLGLVSLCVVLGGVVLGERMSKAAE